MTQTQESQNKIWRRHWSVVLILAVSAGLVIWAMVHLGSWLKSLQDYRAARVIQEKAEDAYRRDTYGGKTPEETFDLFISALEKGQIELASKYFVLGRQEQWRKTMDEYKNKSLLADFIAELKSQKSTLKFEKYPSGIWKISVL